VGSITIRSEMPYTQKVNHLGGEPPRC